MHHIKDVGKGSGIKYTEYKENKDNFFPYYCPSDKPFLCTINTPNYGLCKESADACKQYTDEVDMPILHEGDNKENLVTIRKGYPFNYIFPSDQKDAGKQLFKNPIRNCSKFVVTKEGGICDLPPKFKIMTYNIWHSLKKFPTNTDNKQENKKNNERNIFELEFLEIRVRQVAKIILESKADIICLQEVSLEAYNIIKPIITKKYKYKYEYESNFKPDIDIDGKRGRTVETMCFSKYPALSYKLLKIEGNLSYNDSAIVLEFGNALVFNVYLQAGTSKSPGQSFRWIHYSRCRYNQYLAIGEYLRENNITKPIIVVGDFNTNLDGNEEEWPELRAFNRLNLTDSWKATSQDDPGFTEDTMVNLMRWNTKFEEKQYRIDGIFYTTGSFITNQNEILGKKPISDSTKSRIDISKLQTQFLEYKVSKNSKQELNDILRGPLDLHGNTKTLIWPSDHFAIISDLEFI